MFMFQPYNVTSTVVPTVTTYQSWIMSCNYHLCQQSSLLHQKLHNVFWSFLQWSRQLKALSREAVVSQHSNSSVIVLRSAYCVYFCFIYRHYNLRTGSIPWTCYSNTGQTIRGKNKIISFFFSKNHHSYYNFSLSKSVNIHRCNIKVLRSKGEWTAIQVQL